MGLLSGVDFSKCKQRFVIHAHDAKRAGKHYDLRLEAYDSVSESCVLVSWASRKLNQLLSEQARRIGIFRTENHELKWLRFEGEIPEGYGAGYVRIVDRGTFEVVEEKQGVLVVKFLGEKVKGSYAIVRLSRDSFLLVKMRAQKEFNMAAGIYPYACLLCSPKRMIRRIGKKRRRFEE